MVFDVLVADKASGSFRAMSREADGAAASFDKVGKAAFGITAVFAAFAVNAAVKFESAMTRISTQAGVPIGQINALSKAILGLSPKVGFNPDELATSLYHVESAFRTTGITAGKAIDIVKSASQLAKIGHADLEITTQAIIGVLASGIKGVSNAQDAAAQLNQLVGTGDTTLQKVAESIATGILPTAATLGLTFKDVAAGIATLTDNVTPADTATRNFKTSLLTLVKPSHQQSVAFEEIGLSSLQLAQDFRQPNGLLVGVKDLKDHLDATFPAGQKTALTVAQLDGAQKAYYQNLVSHGTNVKDATKQSLAFRDSITGISAATLRANTVARELGGSKTAGTFLTFIQEIDRLTSKYKDSGTALQAQAKFQEAWANQQKTARQKLDELKASWDVFLVQAGNAILPTLKKIVDALAKHPGIIKAAAAAVGLLAAAWTVSKFASAFAVIGRLTAAILGIGAASTTAAAETAAANLGGAAAAGEGAAAAGLAGRGAAAAEGAGAAGLAGRGAAAARGGAGLLGGLSLGTAVGAGVATAGAVLIPSFLLANQLGKKQSVRDIPQIDKFIGAGPDFLENKIPGLKSDELKQRLIDYANKIGGLDLKLKNFYGDAADNKAIGSFQQALKNSTIDLQSSNKSLDLHAAKNDTDKVSILSNQSALGNLAGKAVLAAKAYEHGTGVLSDYTSNLQLSIPQILDQAQATGINRQAAADYLNKIIQIPGYHVTTLGLVKDAAEKAVNDFLISLSQIPKSISVPIITFLANPIPANQLAGSAFGVDTVGRHAAGGVAKGWSWVGEKGPELVNFGSPSRVLNHQDSMAAAMGGPAVGAALHVEHQTINNNVDVREVAQQVGAAVRTSIATRRL